MNESNSEEDKKCYYGYECLLDSISLFTISKTSAGSGSSPSNSSSRVVPSVQWVVPPPQWSRAPHHYRLLHRPAFLMMRFFFLSSHFLFILKNEISSPNSAFYSRKVRRPVSQSHQLRFKIFECVHVTFPTVLRS